MVKQKYRCVWQPRQRSNLRSRSANRMYRRKRSGGGDGGEIPPRRLLGIVPACTRWPTPALPPPPPSPPSAPPRLAKPPAPGRSPHL